MIVAVPSKKAVRRIMLISLIVIAAVIFLSFVSRNALLNYYLDRSVSRFNKTYQAELKFENVELRGMSSLLAEGIMLKPVKADTLLTIDSVYATLNFWKLLTGRIALNNFILSNTRLLFVKKDSLTNYMFLLDRKNPQKQTADTSTAKSYAIRMKSIMNAVFDKIPDDLSIRNFNIYSDYNNHDLNFHTDIFKITDHQFQSSLLIEENGHQQEWIVKGSIDKYDHVAHVSLYNRGDKKISLPFILFKWNAEVDFDTLTFSLEESNSNSSKESVSGNASLRGLVVHHPRIATERVVVGDGKLNYKINIGRDYYEVDSATNIVFNKLSFHPYLKYRVTHGKQFTCKVDKQDFPAEDLFTSLPQGLFQNLEGIKTKGNLSFHLLFDVDLRSPDSLIFECELKRKNFYVTSFGRTNFTYINEPFEYTAYEKGEPVRTFIVGPQNPNFRSLDQISPYLRNAVLNSEDGAFFSHRGFLPEAFRESIVTNIKERRFARGGSTITMQLVKNVFLNRNKTIARKLEEAIIVWMIENLQLSSKERMFEVYLNVIEWGPLVYGAQEACRFYFNKDASALSYAEALYLTSIIPRPKYFRYVFDNNTGALRDYIQNYYQRMADKMLRKEMITQEDYDRLKPVIELKGPAKKFLLKPDSLQETDSLMILREEYLK